VPSAKVLDRSDCEKPDYRFRDSSYLRQISKEEQVVKSFGEQKKKL
jgi:hypothetical protein